MNKILGSRIKLIRTRKNLSREYLSQKLGLSVHTLTKYEQGQREPNVETLTKISTFLGVSLDTLTCSEFFGHEILSRAVYIAINHLPPDEEDVFLILGHYADYDILIGCYNRLRNDLTTSATKGVLDFINENSKEEFNKIYIDLVSTEIYDLNSEIKDYSQKLYSLNIDPINFINHKDKEFLQSLGYIKDGKLSPPKSSNDKNAILLNDGAFTLDSIRTPFKCKEHIANLIKYKIKDFDFSTLNDEDFNIILKDTLDFIEYEIYKLKNKQ